MAASDFPEKLTCSICLPYLTKPPAIKGQYKSRYECLLRDWKESPSCSTCFKCKAIYKMYHSNLQEELIVIFPFWNEVQEILNLIYEVLESHKRPWKRKMNRHHSEGNFLKLDSATKMVRTEERIFRLAAAKDSPDRRSPGRTDLLRRLTVSTEVDKCFCPRRPPLFSCSEYRGVVFHIRSSPVFNWGLLPGMSKRLSPHLQRRIPEDAYCEKHLEPLQLFCDDDQITLCGQCLRSQEHTHHVVYGVQEAAENYRMLFREISNTLKEKLEAAKSMLADEQEKMVMIQEEEQNFKEMMESEYRIMFRLMIEENAVNFQSPQGCVFNLNLREASLNQPIEFATELKEKSQETLQRLNQLGRENMNKLKESEVRLSEQICSLQKIPAELEKKCAEPTLALLQNARYSLERSESLLLQCLQPAQITDLNLCRITGISKVLKVLQRPITLDPKTAHPCLVLSEDLRSMKLRNIQQDVPGNPGRFDFSATVLGAESFTSGSHYWEVDVEKATKWQLGIYEDSAKGKSNTSKASGDKVLLTGSMMGADFTFWVFPPLRRVFLREQMHKVGVFLDYEYGQISFYDVTKRSLIYNFSCLVFQGALRPIFSLCIPNGGTNSDSLSICLPHNSS